MYAIVVASLDIMLGSVYVVVLQLNTKEFKVVKYKEVLNALIGSMPYMLGKK